MKTKLYQVILCPTGEVPSKDNTATHTIIADHLVAAVNTVQCNPDFHNSDLVSVSFVGEAISYGTLVDFE